MSGVLLGFALPAPKEQVIAGIAGALGLRYRRVLPAEYDLPLSALLEGEGKRMLAPAAELPAEMLVMAGLPKETFDRLLALLRGSAPVALKAVLTPSNAGWSGRRLYRELAAEHEALHGADKMTQRH